MNAKERMKAIMARLYYVPEELDDRTLNQFIVDHIEEAEQAEREKERDELKREVERLKKDFSMAVNIVEIKGAKIQRLTAALAECQAELYEEKEGVPHT